jgi:drug/metabolite transporter (DMT)-like permease
MAEVFGMAAGMNAGFQETRREFSELLRGDAAARARFVDDYEFDLSPCRDDRPFFFNYYKYSGLLKGAKSGPGWYHLDFPVGHMVLLGSLVQIVLLGAVLILAPIWRLRRAGARTPGKLRYLAYFSGLGLGFMFIEIVMMQKMVLFLGHPVYALSVVLAALLAATGIGSLISGRFALRRRTAAWILAGIVGTALLALLATNVVLPLLLGQPLWARIALVTAVLAPLGVALGMGFPTGIRVVRERSPELLPWCWAINGLTSVFASIFCIVLALEIGFTAVLLLAIAVYVAGFLAIFREIDRVPVAV